jgi:hypothetical protein
VERKVKNERDRVRERNRESSHERYVERVREQERDKARLRESKRVITEKERKIKIDITGERYQY